MRPEFQRMRVEGLVVWLATRFQSRAPLHGDAWASSCLWRAMGQLCSLPILQMETPRPTEVSDFSAWKWPSRDPAQISGSGPHCDGLESPLGNEHFEDRWVTYLGRASVSSPARLDSSNPAPLTHQEWWGKGSGPRLWEPCTRKAPWPGRKLVSAGSAPSPRVYVQLQLPSAFSLLSRGVGGLRGGLRLIKLPMCLWRCSSVLLDSKVPVATLQDLISAEQTWRSETPCSARAWLGSGFHSNSCAYIVAEWSFVLRSHKYSGALEAPPGGMPDKGSSPGVRCPGPGHLLCISPEFSLEAVPSEDSIIHSSSPFFQQLLAEHLLCARHQEDSCEWNRPKPSSRELTVQWSRKRGREQ